MAGDSAVTNAPPSFWEAIGLTAMPTNIVAGVFVDYGNQSHIFTPGIEAAWNINNAIGVGALVEHTGASWNQLNDFTMLAGTVTLRHQFAVNVFGAPITVTPYGVAALGTSFGGGSSFATETSAGASVGFHVYGQWWAGLSGEFGTRTGAGALNGTFERLVLGVAYNF